LSASTTSRIVAMGKANLDRGTGEVKN